MSSKLIEKQGTKLRLELEITLDPSSMLNSEDQIAQALNEAGLLATGEALKLLDSDGSSLEHEGKILSSKGKQKKNTKPLMGPKS